MAAPLWNPLSSQGDCRPSAGTAATRRVHGRLLRAMGPWRAPVKQSSHCTAAAIRKPSASPDTHPPRPPHIPPPLPSPLTPSPAPPLDTDAHRAARGSADIHAPRPSGRLCRSAMCRWRLPLRPLKCRKQCAHPYNSTIVMWGGWQGAGRWGIHASSGQTQSPALKVTSVPIRTVSTAPVGN